MAKVTKEYIPCVYDTTALKLEVKLSSLNLLSNILLLKLLSVLVGVSF